MRLFDELKNNYENKQDTFIQILLYQNSFDIISFNKLVKTIVSDLLNNTLDNEKKMEVLKYLFWLYSRVKTLFCSHFVSNDFFKIKNWDDEYFFLFDRVEIIIESILDNNIKYLSEFIDEYGTFNDCTFPDHAPFYKKLFDKE